MKRIFYLSLSLVISIYFHSHAQNAELIQDIPFPRYDNNILNLTPFKKQLFFATREEQGQYTLWKSDGTKDNAHIVSPPDAPHKLKETGGKLTEYNGKLFFTGKSVHEYQEGTFGLSPWYTDGTDAGTKPLLDYPPTHIGSPDFIPLKDKLYFIFNAEDDRSGMYLWVTDGTEKGTKVVKKLLPGRCCFMNINRLIICEDKFFFTIEQGGGMEDLWVSDGTESGTYAMESFPMDDKRRPSHFTAYKDKLFFLRYDKNEAPEPWVTDGTEEGTYMICNLTPSDNRLSPWGRIYHTVTHKDHIFILNYLNGIWVLGGVEEQSINSHNVIKNTDYRDPVVTFTYNDDFYFMTQKLLESEELPEYKITITKFNLWSRSFEDITTFNSKYKSLKFFTNFTEYNNRIYFYEGSEKLWEFDFDGNLRLIGPDDSFNESSYADYGRVEITKFNGSLYFTASYTPDTPPGIYKLTTKSIEKPEPEAEFSVLVYPNPAIDQLSVQLYRDNIEDVNIKIYNMNGQLIKEVDSSGGENLLVHTLDIKDLQGGIYIMQLKSGSQRVERKFVVQ